MNERFGAPGSGPDDGDKGQPGEQGQPPVPSSDPVDHMSAERPPRSKRRPAGWPIALVAAAILVVAGGVTVVLVMNHRADVAAAERREAAERRAAEAKAAKEKAAEEARQAEEEAAAAELAAAEDYYESCTDQLDPLFNSLQKVDARLDVGLNQSDLSTMVGDASIAYNRIDIDELGSGTCLMVGVRLEKAFRAYAGTVSDWNDCIYDYGCDTDALTPSLQAEWLKASNAIDKASHLLGSLDPHSASYDESTASDIV